MPDALMNAREVLSRGMPQRRPINRRRRTRVLENVIDRIEEAQPGQLRHQRLEAQRDFSGQNIDDKRPGGLDVRIIRRTGNADVQPLDQPAEQDEGRAGAPPIFAMTDLGGINGVEGTHDVWRREVVLSPRRAATKKTAADVSIGRRFVKRVAPQLNLFFRYAPIAGASGFTSGPK